MPTHARHHISLQKPHLTLKSNVHGPHIYVFGALHGEIEEGGGAAGFILDRRPGAVVFETALNAAHGAMTGNEVSREQALCHMYPDPRARAFAQLAAQLDQMEDDEFQKKWEQVGESTPSEQLAYIAAFAVDAPLIFGDRPKIETYQRLLWLPSIRELDEAFSSKSRDNYKGLVQGLWPQDQLRSNDKSNTVDHILMTERNAILLATLEKVHLTSGRDACVVGVVGMGHLEGMEDLWKTREYIDVVAQLSKERDPVESNRLESEEEVGLRRALFDGIIRLTCRPDVIYDVESSLSAYGGASSSAYELTRELYGSCRMLLASLESPEELAAVCRGWKCDMWEVLEPVRSLKPSQGGKGYSEDLVLELRSLNFELNE